MVTIGLPFSVFKLLTGNLLLDRAWLAPVGWALIALGAVDLVVNSLNLVPLTFGRQPTWGVCLAEVVARRLRPERRSWHEFGLSVDMLLSFSLVATVVGFRLFREFSPAQTSIWNACVVLNVLGAGFGRLSTSIGSLRDERSGRPGT